jgi:hypothetical protein
MLRAIALALASWLTACASSPPQAQVRPMPPEADIAAAKALRLSRSVEPVSAAAEACALLKEGQAAFNARLSAAGYGVAATWQMRPDYLEAAPFTLFQSDTLSLRFTANLVNGEAVCLVRFEGPLSVAAWEELRREYLTRSSWTSFAPADAPFYFETVKDGMHSSFNFTPPTRRTLAGVMMEFRPMGREDSVR